MRTVIIISLLLIAPMLHAQQSDIGIAVRKKQMLSITPDSMYFESHTSRRFVIRGIPAGCKVKGEFRGLPFYTKDSMIILQPMFVYQDSDVVKYKGYLKNLASNESTTTGKYYITGLTVKIVDANGLVRDSLSRTCYIKPQTYNPPKSIPLSSATFDPLMKPLLKSAGLDSTTDNKPKKGK